MSKRKNTNKKKKYNKLVKNLSPNKQKLRKFFKKIGIKPLLNPSDGQLTHILKSRFGQETADTFWEKFEEGSQALWDFFHSNVELAKIRYGNDFDILCSIGEQIMEVPIACGSRILDVGGGVGPLAFFIADLNDVNVTVADKFPETGRQWAEEIGESRVEFIKATLPALEVEGTDNYDVILMSRVLSFVEELKPLREMDDFNLDSYFNRVDVQGSFEALKTIVNIFNSLLKPDGIVIMVDGWIDARILMISKALKKYGLFPNTEYFRPENISKDYSMNVFSRSPNKSMIRNIPCGLATILNTGDNGTIFNGATAESIRKLFEGTAPTMTFEFSFDEANTKVKAEVIEKYGLGLLYQTFFNGNRRAIITSSILIPKIIQDIQTQQKIEGEN